VMLVGESKQQNKAETVVRECLSNPMLDIDYHGATGALIHITGGSDLTLQEAEGIARDLTYELDSRADVIWGARIKSEFEGRVRVMAIMTGVRSAQILGSQNRGAYPNPQPYVGQNPRNSSPGRGPRELQSGGSLIDMVQ
jgi:cell division protein FtsZ